jgi:hypothetical protein
VLYIGTATYDLARFRAAQTAHFASAGAAVTELRVATASLSKEVIDSAVSSADMCVSATVVPRHCTHLLLRLLLQLLQLLLLLLLLLLQLLPYCRRLLMLMLLLLPPPPPPPIHPPPPPPNIVRLLFSGEQ